MTDQDVGEAKQSNLDVGATRAPSFPVRCTFVASSSGWRASRPTRRAEVDVDAVEPSSCRGSSPIPSQRTSSGFPRTAREIEDRTDPRGVHRRPVHLRFTTAIGCRAPLELVGRLAGHRPSCRSSHGFRAVRAAPLRRHPVHPQRGVGEDRAAPGPHADDHAQHRLVSNRQPGARGTLAGVVAVVAMTYSLITASALKCVCTRHAA